MQINLRKAKALETEIRSLINSIRFNDTTVLDKYSTNPVTTVTEAETKLLADYERVTNLVQMMYRIRRAIGYANTLTTSQYNTSISDVLANIEESKMLVSRAESIANMQVQRPFEEIEKRLEDIRNTPLSDNLHRAISSPTVMTSCVSASNIELAKSVVKQHKKMIRTYNDMLLQMNVTTEITLSPESVTVLTKEGLL